MLFLLLSLLCAASLILLFRIFGQRGLPMFQVIVFNYWAAALCSIPFFPNVAEVFSPAIVTRPWFPFSLLLGAVFFLVFNLTSLTTSRFGVSTASVAMKLGLVFPVLLAFTIYGEPFSVLKLLGILFAFGAVVLCSLRENESTHQLVSGPARFLPFIVFIGSGVCDSSVQYANKMLLTNGGLPEFVFFDFVSAASIGSCGLLFLLATGRTTFSAKALVAGLVLGVPNYFSFYFMLRALDTVSWGSSVVFPVSNLGTVAVATIAALIFFHEKLSRLNWLGMLLAFASIACILFS